MSNPLPRMIDVGIATLGGRRLAIPAGALREALPCPARLEPAFCDHPAVAGTIAVRGSAIPVIDLHRLGAFPPADAARSVIVVLRHQGWLLGIRLDGVYGIQRTPRGAFQPLRQPGEGALFVSQGLVEGEEVIGVIDPEALFAVPGILHASEAAQEADRGGTAGGGTLRHWLVVEAAGTRLAVDANLVAASFACEHLAPSTVPTPGWPKVARYLGSEFPLFDDLAVLGLGGIASETGTALALRVGDRLVGWQVDRLASVTMVRDDALHPLDSSDWPGGAQLFTAALTGPDGEQALVLDSERLLAVPAIVAMAKLCRRDRDLGEAGAVREDQGYLVFESGGRYGALRLDQIKRVERSGPVRLKLDGGRDVFGVAGLSDGALPVAMPFGLPPGCAADGLLVVVPRSQRPALSVERLCTLSYGSLAQGEGCITPFVDELVDGARRSIDILPFD